MDAFAGLLSATDTLKTQHGKTYDRHRDFGGLYFLANGASAAKELDYHYSSPNGVGLSPDEKTVFMADTMTGRM